MSISRRLVRETAVQFLYCLNLEGSTTPDTSANNPFWETLLERDSVKLVKARAKAVLLIAQGRAARVEKLSRLVPECATRLKVDPNSESYRDALLRFLDQENALSSSVQQLKDALVRDPQADKGLVEPALERAFALDRQLVTARKTVELGAQDYPAFKADLEPILANIARLNRISERFDLIQHPEKAPDDNAIKHIATGSADLSQLISEASTLATGVLSNNEAIDAELSAAIANFTPERLNPVDRAVLRLATWEMKLSASPIPPAVAINEAIEVARKYGSNESARFVNGVLDAVNPESPAPAAPLEVPEETPATPPADQA